MYGALMGLGCGALSVWATTRAVYSGGLRWYTIAAKLMLHLVVLTCAALISPADAVICAIADAAAHIAYAFYLSRR